MYLSVGGMPKDSPMHCANGLLLWVGEYSFSVQASKNASGSKLVNAMLGGLQVDADP